MTDRARARIGTRFERVARGEPGAMDARRERIFEVRGRGQHRDGLAVTLRAEALAMARLARIARRRRGRAVLVQPIAVVREVALRQHRGRLEAAMTRVAGSCIARRFVRVTAKARRHRRA